MTHHWSWIHLPSNSFKPVYIWYPFQILVLEVPSVFTACWFLLSEILTWTFLGPVLWCLGLRQADKFQFGEGKWAIIAGICPLMEKGMIVGGCMDYGEGNAERLMSLCTFLLLFELVSPSIAKDSMRLMTETRLFLNLRFLMKWFQRSQVSLTYLSPSEPDPAWQTNEASPFFWKAVPVKCSTDQEVPPILLKMICCKKALGLKVEFFVTRACSQSPV